jgi:hypothetical protein
VIDTLVESFVKFVVFVVMALPAVMFCIGIISFCLSIGRESQG